MMSWIQSERSQTNADPIDFSWIWASKEKPLPNTNICEWICSRVNKWIDFVRKNISALLK